MICTRQVEGISGDEPRARYGGDDDAHDCGSLEYVRIEFAGFDLAENDELNGLTVGGCGTQTTLDYIQVHRGLDDAVEFFGGTASISHLVASGMGDDGLDWDTGWRGDADDVIIHHFASSTGSPNGIEADNNEDSNNTEPRSAPNVTNVTIIGDGSRGGTAADGWGIVHRVGSWGVLSGLVVEGFGAGGYDMRNGAWSVPGGWPSGIVVENSCFDNIGPNYPADTNDEAETDEMVCMGNCLTGLFDEPTQLADAARSNTEAASGLDFAAIRPACTGTGTPDYAITNTACLGAFGGVGSDNDWTTGWTAYPAGSQNPATCP